MKTTFLWLIRQNEKRSALCSGNVNKFSRILNFCEKFANLKEVAIFISHFQFFTFSIIVLKCDFLGLFKIRKRGFEKRKWNHVFYSYMFKIQLLNLYVINFAHCSHKAKLSSGLLTHVNCGFSWKLCSSCCSRLWRKIKCDNSCCDSEVLKQKSVNLHNEVEDVFESVLLLWKFSVV